MNRIHAEGANGGCYFNVEECERDGFVRLEVGWSCVRVFDDVVPVTWLAELVAIATDGGKRGERRLATFGEFLRERDYGQPSYAVMCDPIEKSCRTAREVTGA